MPISGDLLVALLALAFVGLDGQADSGVAGHQDTDRPGTTTTAPTSPSPSSSAAMYLPRPTVQEPADPCKAGNYIRRILIFLCFYFVASCTMASELAVVYIAHQEC